MVEIVLATRNPKKFRELKALLAVPGVCLRSLATFPRVPLVRETGRTFEQNALTKALAVARATGRLAIADDSGLEVDALNGAPGVRSARFAGRHGDDRANTAKLLRVLHTLPPSKRHARFHCALALASPVPILPRRRDASQRVVSSTRSTARRRTARAKFYGASPTRLLAVTRGELSGRIAHAAKGHRGFGYDPVFLVPRLGKTVAQLPRAVKNRISHRAKAAARMRTVLVRLLTQGDV